MDTNKKSGAIRGSASHYELRSKREEVPESKLKNNKNEVKEVNGTKGRKKRAVCSTSSAAAASDGIEDGSGDLGFTEMTFSIDHIREQILRSLPNKDLCNCRLVCRSWNVIASLELQNRIKSRLDLGTKEFSQFLSLLDKRPESILGLPLPYSKFSFIRETYSPTFLKNRGLLNFLNKYGPDLQELSFVSESCDTVFAEETDMIDFVTNLLLHQTPNLSKLHLMFHYSVSWVEGDSFRWWNSTLLATDPEFKEIHSKTWGTNTKLKVFSLDGVSAKLIEVVAKMAPNLTAINAQLYPNATSDCKYFVEPLNRLGCLKTVEFRPNSLKELKMFENIFNTIQRDGTTLSLREISFRFKSRVYAGYDQDLWATPQAPHFLESPDLRVRAENIINRLLECSWNLLETLKWEPSTGFIGVKWPEVLPNLQELTVATLSDHVFPNGCFWSSTFPKLRSLSLYDAIGRSSFTTVMDLLFQKQKVESVKDVHVHAEEHWSKEDQLTVAQLKRLQNIFPNAEIEISVPVYFIPVGCKLKLQKRCHCRM